MSRGGNRWRGRFGRSELVLKLLDALLEALGVGQSWVEFVYTIVLSRRTPVTNGLLTTTLDLASATRLAREGALLGGLDRRHVWPRASLRLRQTQTRSRSWSWSWSRERNCARMLNLTAPTCERRALGNSPRASKIRPHSEERGRLQSPARLRLQALHRLGVARGRLSACHFVSRRLMPTTPPRTWTTAREFDSSGFVLWPVLRLY